MTALARILFPAPALRRSPSTILGWWESRRPIYNAIVGGAGMFTLGTMIVVSWLPPFMNVRVPWPAVVVYGVLANVFYSLGSAVEALCERLWGDDVMPVGPTLFRYGLVFSVGLTLLPIPLMWAAYLVNVIRFITSLAS